MYLYGALAGWKTLGLGLGLLNQKFNVALNHQSNLNDKLLLVNRAFVFKCCQQQVVPLGLGLDLILAYGVHSCLLLLDPLCLLAVSKGRADDADPCVPGQAPYPKQGCF